MRSADVYKIAMVKLFSMVGAVYDPSVTHEESWYTLYTWTPQQRTEYTQWLAELVHCNMDYSMADAYRLAKMFVELHGWDTDEEMEACVS